MLELNRDDPTCERARAWASLALDDALSEVEQALLAQHTASCQACAAACDQLRALTVALRSAPLERPNRPLVAAPVGPARYRRGVTAVRLAAAATLVALAAGIGVFVTSVGSGERLPQRVPPSDEIVLVPDHERDFRHIRGEPQQPLMPSPLARVGAV